MHVPYFDIYIPAMMMKVMAMVVMVMTMMPSWTGNVGWGYTWDFTHQDNTKVEQWKTILLEQNLEYSYYHEEINNIHVWFFFQLWYLILLIYYYYYMDLLLLWTGSRSYIQVNTNIWVREDVNNNNIIIISIPFGIDSYLYHSLLDWFRSPYRRNLFFVFACYV